MSAALNDYLNNINYNEDLYTSSTAEKANAQEYKQAGETDSVDTDQFLTLLVTQMTNQDPLEPMQDTEMMAQFAQLQQLDNQQEMTEAMHGMSKEYAMQGATSMIGKEVTAEDEFGGEIRGLAIKTKYEDDKVQIVLDNGKVVDYSDVIEVEDKFEGPDIQAASSLMQKYVVGIDSDAKVHEGIVKNITTMGDMLYVETYEGDMIPVDGVAQVRELTPSEDAELQEVLNLQNQYIEAPNTDNEGNPDGVITGIVKEVFRKDGQYWVETWGGQAIYVKDITSNRFLTTDEMQQMEDAKKYTGRFIKANEGKMAGIAEGFFFKEGEFYLYSARGEAIRVDEVSSVRDATNDDADDFGTTDGLTELQILNLNQAIKDHLGEQYSGFDIDGEEVSGKVTSVYYRGGLIMLGTEEGGEIVSPASLLGV